MAENGHLSAVRSSFVLLSNCCCILTNLNFQKHLKMDDIEASFVGHKFFATKFTFSY